MLYVVAAVDEIDNQLVDSNQVVKRDDFASLVDLSDEWEIMNAWFCS